MFQNHKKIKKGFTLVELLMSMTIVSFLMLSIALMIMQMTNMMSRGNAMRELNAAARTINRDFTQTFNSLSELDWTGYKPIADAGSSDNYVNYSFPRGARIASGGAFCTGNETYLWSIGDSDVFKYDDNSSGIRLAKVYDAGKAYCNNESASQMVSNGFVNVRKRDLMADLLPESGEGNLQIYSISFNSSDKLRDVSSNQRAINISYVLGTGDTTRGNAKVIDNSTLTCNDSFFSNTCVANRFDLFVRTLGRK